MTQTSHQPTPQNKFGYKFGNRFNFALLSFCGVVGAWIASSFLLPTFDLDEALYRRMAEEMKLSGKYLVPTWDGTEFLDKPPVLVWAVLAASSLIDGSQIAVSTFAARLPGLLFTAASVGLLMFFWPRFLRAENAASSSNTRFEMQPLFVGCLYGMALLPSLAGASVLYDPLLSLCLLPAFFTIVSLHQKQHTTGLPGLAAPNVRESLILGISMGAAVCVKGLIGIILPCFALFISSAYTLFVLAKKDWAAPTNLQHAQQTFVFKARAGLPTFVSIFKMLAALMRFFALPVSLAAGVGLVFFGYIYAKGGEVFVRHFFIVEHFGRGTMPREGHSGPFFYHFVVMALGGGGLTGLLFRLLPALFLQRLQKRLPDSQTKQQEQANLETPGVSEAQSPFLLRASLSWVASFVLFFSFMSTKLPNYTWPAWGALIFFTGLVVFRWNSKPQTFLSNHAEIFNLQNLDHKSRGLAFLNSFLFSFLKICAFFAWFVPCVLGGVFVLLALLLSLPWAALLPELLLHASSVFNLPHWSAQSPRGAQIIQAVAAVGPVPFLVPVSLGAVGLLFVFSGRLLKGIGWVPPLQKTAFGPITEQRISALTALSAGVLLLVSWGIAPFAGDLAQKPLYNLTAKALLDFEVIPSRFATFGIKSPTASSAYGPLGLRQFSKGDFGVFEENGADLVLAPLWLAQKCKLNNFRVVASEGYAVLCQRSF